MQTATGEVASFLHSFVASSAPLTLLLSGCSGVTVVAPRSLECQSDRGVFLREVCRDMHSSGVVISNEDFRTTCAANVCGGLP